MPKTRDARKDPHPDDELEKVGKRYMSTRIVDHVTGNIVTYIAIHEDGEHQMECAIKSWRAWAKGARVIHAAD